MCLLGFGLRGTVCGSCFRSRPSRPLRYRPRAAVRCRDRRVSSHLPDTAGTRVTCRMIVRRSLRQASAISGFQVMLPGKTGSPLQNPHRCAAEHRQGPGHQRLDQRNPQPAECAPPGTPAGWARSCVIHRGTGRRRRAGADHLTGSAEPGDDLRHHRERVGGAVCLSLLEVAIDGPYLVGNMGKADHRRARRRASAMGRAWRRTRLRKLCNPGA